VGHIGGGLLVTGVDQADIVPNFMKGVEGGHDLDARQSEDRRHPFGTKLSDKGLRTTHLWHKLFLLTIDYPATRNGVKK
jgi:hypothetical protein